MSIIPYGAGVGAIEKLMPNDSPVHRVASADTLSLTTTERATRETFLDWEPADGHEPEERWTTREDLLAALAREGIAVDRDDIRTWQLARVIPYGVSKWRNGRKQTFYAGWMVDLLREVRAQQAAGRSMGEIAMALRALFHGPGRRIAGQSAVIDQIVPAPPGLELRLAQLARSAEQATGTRIVAAEIRLLDERGRPLVFTFDIPQQNAI